ncbi:putative chalcone--flavonone isomerase 3 [Sesamum angolense]|uniref:Chalcone-flavonone isomerase family protein n=1 Tax=Sesamum angolense TaxID=2727404 RepID=A0AAE2BZG8_9LAMI|nr:putative chalcone--flavonone isomerase 3 [Sesamum angolense]
MLQCSDSIYVLWVIINPTPSDSSDFSIHNHFAGYRSSSPLKFLIKIKSKMGTEVEVVMVDEVPFPPLVNITKPLSLLGHGITDIEIHFLQIKFTAIGVYLDPQIVSHLQKWKGKSAAELAQDDHFFQAIISAPVDKLVRVVVIKEIKGSQFGVQIESAVRDRLAEVDLYEEEEEEAVEQLWSFSSPSEGKEEAKMEVKNGNVVEMIQKWYLGGTTALSPTTVSSLATSLSPLLLSI